MKRLLTMISAAMLSLLLCFMISSCSYLPFLENDDTDADTKQETESQTTDSKADSRSEESTKAPEKDPVDTNQPSEDPYPPVGPIHGQPIKLGPGEYGIIDRLMV